MAGVRFHQFSFREKFPAYLGYPCCTFYFLGFFPWVFDILFSIIASFFLSVILRSRSFLAFLFSGENLFGKTTKIIVAD